MIVINTFSVSVTSSFTDINGYWTETAISSAVERNLFSGIGANTFSDMEEIIEYFGVFI